MSGPMQLYSGRESRTAGAPGQSLPHLEDRVQQVMAFLMSQDQEGMLYGGDREALREEAIRLVDQEQLAAQQAPGDRAAGRAAARGADPDSLPLDEYGNVSPRTVQDANMSRDDQEAGLLQYQDVADAEIRDLREGRFHGAAAQQRQYAQDYGLGVTRSKTGKTDLDYIREQQDHQGYLRTGRGEMIPVGPPPTPESVESRRVFNEWANENPGTERQATYDPAAYAAHREEVRDGYRNKARSDRAIYGTGPDERVTDAQRRERAALRASEDRVAESQREVSILRLAERAGVTVEEARAMMDGGRAAVVLGREGAPGPAGAAGPAGGPAPLTAAERRLESQKLRDMANTRQMALRATDKAMRQDTLLNQRLLTAPGARGVANAINELPEGWRQIAILDRLTNGRRGGATPLDVEAQQISNTLPVFRNMVTGMMQDMDPAAAADRQMQRQLMLAQMPPEQRTALSIQMGQPMGTGYSSAHVGQRWNYWINAPGGSSAEQRERGFRMEMEGLGYSPAQIDAWIDQRRAGEPPPPEPDVGRPQAGRPGGVGDMGQGFSG